MGRPNYTNRKIEGLKLGQAVAKDLIKRIPPNIHAKAAFRDPIIELDVSGKCLESEGFREIATALVESINYDGENGRVVRLEELCLKNNKLDAKCLINLGNVVRLAAHDLRDLDLSNNSISVVTDEDSAAMEYFLRSFAYCDVLRRVDFSGNPLGIRAYEILAKVYGNEEPHLVATINDCLQPDPHHSKIGQNNAAANGDRLEGRLGSLHIVTDAEVKGSNTINCGLRSIPYLIFSDTSITETSALHLSYIIPQHPPPTQLLKRVPPAKAGLQAQQLIAYDLDRRCQGLVYFPSTELGNTGTKLLDLAERTRRNLFAELDQEIAKDSLEERAQSYTTLASELDRARSRIQSNTLREHGAKCNDLWYTALKMLRLGRTICPTKVEKAPASRSDSVKQPTRNSSATNGFTPHPPQKPTPLTSRSPNQPQTLRLGQEYRNGKLVLTPIVPSPQTPRPPSLRAPSTPTTPSPLKALPPPPQEPFQTQLPAGFTEDVWRRIAVYITGADGIMSEGQQLSVLRWAMDRRTLAQEKESLGKPRSAQIWKVLDGTGCLAYEMKT